MSAAPSKYTPNTSFKAFSQSNPTAQQPGDKIDAEFNEIRTVTDAVIDRLAIIQRDDGGLANASVGRETLKPEVVAGINSPTTWAPFTLYSVRDSVIHLSKWQWALEDHTSGAEFDPSKWQVIADFTEIGGSVVGVSPSAQGQLVRWGNALGTQILDAGQIVTADIADGAVTGAKIPDAAIGTAHIGDGAVTAAKLAAGAAAMSGEVRMWAPAAAPAGWLLCDGSLVSRATYAALFAAIGTTYGAGDGTTFGLPDLRGRAPIGAGQGSGLTNRALGSTVGAETHTLTAGQIPAHTHSGTTGLENANHAHVGTTDAQGIHSHSVTIPNGANGGAGLDAAGSGGGAVYGTSADGSHAHNVTTGTENAAHAHAFTTDGGTGGGASHNNMQPSLAINFIIKT